MIEFEAAAILFDNDGVLVDSHEEGLQAWQQLCEEFELDFSVIVNEFVGCRPEDTLGRHVPAANLARAVERLEDLEVALADGTRTIAGASALVNALSGAKWAVATSAGGRLAEARWNGAGIDVGVTVVAEDVTAGKPDPQPYLLAAERLGVDAADCIVFEDSPAGGLAGRAAGAKVIAVGGLKWTFEPDARVSDLSAVEVLSATTDRVILKISAT